MSDIKKLTPIDFDKYDKFIAKYGHIEYSHVVQDGLLFTYTRSSPNEEWKLCDAMRVY